MSELDVAAQEMAGARRELQEALTMASVWAKAQAEGGDKVAAALSERIDSAFDRLRMANIAAATAMEEEGRG